MIFFFMMFCRTIILPLTAAEHLLLQDGCAQLQEYDPRLRPDLEQFPRYAAVSGIIQSAGHWHGRSPEK